MATFELKMPKLGESVTEGTIGKWLKQPGDTIAKDDLVVEIQTDKVNTEIASTVDGVLKEIKIQEGSTAEVGALLAVLETAEGSAQPEAKPPVAAVASAEAKAAPAEEAPPAPVAAPEPATANAAAVEPSPGDGNAAPARSEVRAAPSVRKLASENSIDLAQVEGTGLDGRVSREDVERHIASGGKPSTQQAQPSGATPAAPKPAPLTKDELVPLSQMRKAIANAMVVSKTTIPHAAAMVEVDWTNVTKVRDAEREDFKAREGFDLTFLPFAIRAVCLALRDNSLVNATWTDKGVLKLKAINLGIAISLGDEGLVVPVLKNADELSIVGIARGVRDLASRARSRKLILADFEGGTFTVNNGGTLGTYLSYPIVNPPQAAIMTTEAISKRVVVLEGDVMAIRSMGNLVMSFDHRVMDGATAARFLKQVKEWIQSVNESVPIS